MKFVPLVVAMTTTIAAVGCSAETMTEEEANAVAQRELAIVSSGDLHINEILASGAGFVELVNDGATSIDLSDYKFQTDSSTSCTLSGTLAAGAYTTIDSSSCSGPSFGGTSASREYKLLNASDDSLEESQTYPAAAGGPMEICSSTHSLCGIHPYLTPGNPSFREALYNSFCVPVCQDQYQPVTGWSWKAAFIGADSMASPSTEWVTGAASPGAAN